MCKVCYGKVAYRRRLLRKKYKDQDKPFQCTHCGVWKSARDFHVDGTKRGHKTQCKICVLERQRQYDLDRKLNGPPKRVTADRAYEIAKKEGRVDGAYSCGICGMLANTWKEAADCCVPGVRAMDRKLKRRGVSRAEYDHMARELFETKVRQGYFIENSLLEGAIV
jgi:transcription elongation factor Elf1